MNRIASVLNRIPHSPQLRQVVSAYYILQGVGYSLTYLPGSTLTTSYQLQALLMPVWVWAILSFVVGGALFSTVKTRHGLLGRIVAGLVAGMAAGQLGMYVEVHAYTAIAQYGIILTIMIGEAIFTSGGGGRE